MLRTLITSKYSSKWDKELHAITTDVKFSGWGPTGHKLLKDDLIEELKDCGMIFIGFENVTDEVIAACPDLKVIVCCRNEAFASVDIDAATKRGIPVLSARGRNAISVAEYTMGLLLSACKNICLTDYKLKHTDELTGQVYEDKTDKSSQKVTSEWSADPKAPMAVYGNYPELYGKKFGMIGFGMIGRELAKRALAFETELLIYDPYTDPESVPEGGILVDLPTLMKESDFISINCNVTPETTGLISREMINLMKPTAYIVNTARAPIMDYDALFDALNERRIEGAALDVYPVEPIEHNNKFLFLTNVVLTPHLAGACRDIWDHQNEIVFENLRMLFSGRRPKTIENPQVLDDFFAEHPELLIFK